MLQRKKKRREEEKKEKREKERKRKRRDQKQHEQNHESINRRLNLEDDIIFDKRETKCRDWFLFLEERREKERKRSE